MATLFGRASSITRGSGQSAVGAAAYRSCSTMSLSVTDQQTNISFDVEYDYSKKKGLAYSSIHAPEHAPQWVYDRKTLWQNVEDVETKSNARLAGEYMLALPKELTVEQNIELLKDFVDQSFVSRGLVVDVNFHNDNPNNPHAHIMYALRELVMQENGEIGFSSHRYRELQTNAFLYAIKEEHKQLVNEAYAKYGHEYRLEWGAARGQMSTIHHGGMRDTILRNEQIIRQNAEKIIADPTIVIDRLDFNKAVFSREDIERELEKSLAVTLKNAPVSSQDALDIYVKGEVVGMLDTVLLSSKLTMVNPCDLRGRILFAKTQSLELENRLIANMKQLAVGRDHALAVTERDIAPYAPGREFSPQQKEVIRNICGGSNLNVLEGWPGAGESTVTGEIVRQYIEAGYEVVAAAPTNKAAQELSAKLGIEVLTTSKLRMQWQYARGAASVPPGLSADYYQEKLYNLAEGSMNKNTLLVLDEASMLDVATSDYFVSEVSKSGAKLLALGDNNQNQAIGSKGGFSRMGEIGERNVLTEVNRHQNPDETIRALHIEATSALCNYQPLKAISIYDQLGKINILENEEDKQAAVASRYIEKVIAISEAEGISVADTAKKVVVSAYTNAEINNLNGMVRVSLKSSGVLSENGQQFISGGVHGRSNMVELCEGDRIIFTSNLREKDGYGGVLNNELATIEKIVANSGSGQGEFIANVDGAEGVRQVRIKTGEQGRVVTFRHGYAVTNCAVQGASSPYKIFSMDQYSGFEASLVGLTRHVIDCEIFAARDTLENEVYKTKDLDVEKVRENYEAIGYEYVTSKGDKGADITKRVDVPLWKLGIGLLTSKRSDLSFAIDNSYGHAEIDLQRRYSALQAGYENIRSEFAGHEGAIEHFEQLANTPLVMEELGSNEMESSITIKAASDDGKGGSNIEPDKTQFELFTAKHFEVNGGVQLDVKGMLETCRLNPMSEQETIDHVAALKTGVVDNGSHSKLEWDDLANKDQHLVLASYVEKEDLVKLLGHYDNISNLQEELRGQGEEAAKLFNEIRESGLENHQALTGNYGAVRDYLTARARIRFAYESEGLVNSRLQSAALQKTLTNEIQTKYGVKLKYLNLDIKSLTKAEGEFARGHEQENAEMLEKDPEYKAKEIAEYRAEQLKEIIKQDDFKLIVQNGSKFAADILASHSEACSADKAKQSSNIKNISALHIEVSVASREIEEATTERAKCAAELIKHYDGHVGVDEVNAEGIGAGDDKNQPVISKILAQVNCNYHTLQKHAQLSDERHYFSRKARESLGKNEDYQHMMQSIAIAQERDLSIEETGALIDAHDGLCMHTETTRDYLDELKLERVSVQSEQYRVGRRVKAIQHYQNTEFRHFIGTIYGGNSQEVISRLDGLLEQNVDHKQLAMNLAKNPEMLGEVKERGLIAKMFRAGAARQVDGNLAIFAKRIDQYIEGHEEMRALNSEQQSAGYGQRLRDIDQQIVALRKGLPSDQEIELLQDIGKLQSRSEYAEHVQYKDAREARASKLNTEKLAGQINELFREDKSLDLLFNYQIKHNLFLSGKDEKQDTKNADRGSNSTNTNTNTKGKQVDGQQAREPEPRITFEQVKSALSSSHAEDIFRQYAPMINGKSEFQRKGDELKSGSIYMAVRGNKAGLWHRFSDGSKGDVFGLVREATGCSSREALDIVADKVGVRPSLEGIGKGSWSGKIPAQSKATQDAMTMNNQRDQQRRDSWVASGVVPDTAPQFNADKHLSFVKDKGSVVSLVHEYRSKDDQLLGYAVRIEDREGRKQVLPVAWCHNEAKGQSKWNMKGFSDNGYKPIYGRQKISYEPLKPVLIVEGEKTADRAQELLPDHNVISWMGGAQGIHKVDWSQLKHTEVTIWPDNDKPGMEAASNIQQYIDNHNGFSGMVSIVDTKQLGLPEKWDLADEVPEHLQAKGVAQIVSDISADISTGATSTLERKAAANDIVEAQNKQLLSAIDMLEASGRIDKDEYTSKDMYIATLTSIAANKEIDLGNSESFVENIRSVQNEYNKMQMTYIENQHINNNINNNTNSANPASTATANSKSEQAIANIVRDTVVLHQLELGLKQLTATHQQLIQQTVEQKVGQLKQGSDADISQVAGQVHLETSSSQWYAKLEEKNAEQTNNLKSLHAEQRTDKEIRKHLRSVSMHIGLMEKMGVKVDKHALLPELRSKSLEEKEEYADNMVGVAAKKHMLPQMQQLKQERSDANDTASLLKVMMKEHEFFNDLHQNYEVSVCLTKDQELINNMHIANRFNRDTMYSSFEKLVRHVADHNIMNNEDLNKALKDSTNMHQLHKDLHAECNSHHRNIIDQHLEHIEHRGELHIEHHVFKDQTSYLKHLQRITHHGFLPHDHINQQLKHIEQAKQQEQVAQKDMHLNRNMGGPSI